MPVMMNQAITTNIAIANGLRFLPATEFLLFLAMDYEALR
jgi:hypothetical protein